MSKPSDKKPWNLANADEKEYDIYDFNNLPSYASIRGWLFGEQPQDDEDDIPDLIPFETTPDSNFISDANPNFAKSVSQVSEHLKKTQKSENLPNIGTGFYGRRALFFLALSELFTPANSRLRGANFTNQIQIDNSNFAGLRNNDTGYLRRRDTSYYTAIQLPLATQQNSWNSTNILPPKISEEEADSQIKLQAFNDDETPAPTRFPTPIPVASTSTPTRQPTLQPTRQPTFQPTVQPTLQPTVRPTSRPSRQPTGRPSTHPTSQPSGQPSIQPTSQPTRQPTRQPSAQPSSQPSLQPSRHPSSKPSSQPSAQPSLQPSRHPSSKPSSQPSRQPSGQPTKSPSSKPSGNPSLQPSGQPSAKPSIQPTSKPSGKPSVQPSSGPTNQPSTQPSGQPSSIPSLQPISRPTRIPSSQPSAQPTIEPSNQPTSVPSNQPSGTPSRQPSSQPSTRPSRRPSVQPSAQPSGSPSNKPSSRPSKQPSRQPSGQPTDKPSNQPSGVPSSEPSRQPSSKPSLQPYARPSALPTSVPSLQPIAFPSAQPSSQPSFEPSAQPTSQPTTGPSSDPSAQPSNQPSKKPSAQPSSFPTSLPTDEPTRRPVAQPSRIPSRQPTVMPSVAIINGEIVPSGHPSVAPTDQLYTLTPTGELTFAPTSTPSQKDVGNSGSDDSNLTEIIVGTIGGVSAIAIAAYLVGYLNKQNAVNDLQNLVQAVAQDPNATNQVASEGALVLAVKESALRKVVTTQRTTKVKPEIVLHDKQRNLVIRFKDEAQFKAYSNHMRFRDDLKLEAMVAAKDPQKAQWLQKYLSAIALAAQNGNGEEVRRLISDAESAENLKEILDLAELTQDQKIKFTEFLASFVSPETGAAFYSKYYGTPPEFLAFNINQADELFLFENFRPVDDSFEPDENQGLTEDGTHAYDISHVEEYYLLDENNALTRKPDPIYIIDREGNLLIFKNNAQLDEYREYLRYPTSIEARLDQESNPEIVEEFRDYLRAFAQAGADDDRDTLGELLLNGKLEKFFASAHLNEEEQIKFKLFLGYSGNISDNFFENPPEFIHRDTQLFSTSANGGLFLYENHQTLDQENYSISEDRSEITYIGEDGKEIKSSSFFIDNVSNKATVYETVLIEGYSQVEGIDDIVDVAYTVEPVFYLDNDKNLIQFQDQGHLQSYQDLEDFIAQAYDQAEFDKVEVTLDFLIKFDRKNRNQIEELTAKSRSEDDLEMVSIEDMDFEEMTKQHNEERAKIEESEEDKPRLQDLLAVMNGEKPLVGYFEKYCQAPARILEEVQEYKFVAGNLYIYENFRTIDSQNLARFGEFFSAEDESNISTFTDEKSGAVTLYQTTQVQGYHRRNADDEREYVEYQQPKSVYFQDPQNRMLKFESDFAFRSYQSFLYYRANFVEHLQESLEEKPQWLENYLKRIEDAAPDKEAVESILAEEDSQEKLQEIFDTMGLNHNGRKQFQDYLRLVGGQESYSAHYREYFGMPPQHLKENENLYSFDNGNLIIHNEDGSRDYADGYYYQERNSHEIKYSVFTKPLPVLFLDNLGRMKKFRGPDQFEIYKKHVDYAANLVEKLRDTDHADWLEEIIEAAKNSAERDENKLAQIFATLGFDQSQIDQFRAFLEVVENPDLEEAYYAKYYGELPEILEKEKSYGFENGNLVTYSNHRELDEDNYTEADHESRRFVDKDGTIFLYDIVEEAGYHYQTPDGAVAYQAYKLPEKIYLLDENQRLKEFSGEYEFNAFREFTNYLPNLFAKIASTNPKQAEEFQTLLASGKSAEEIFEDPLFNTIANYLWMTQAEKIQLEDYVESIGEPRLTEDFYRNYFGDLPDVIENQLDYAIDEDYNLFIHENSRNFDPAIHVQHEDGKIFYRAANQGEEEIEAHFIQNEDGSIIIFDRKQTLGYYEYTSENTIDFVYPPERIVRDLLDEFIEESEEILVEKIIERVAGETEDRLFNQAISEAIQEEIVRNRLAELVNEVEARITREIVKERLDEITARVEEEFLNQFSPEIYEELEVDEIDSVIGDSFAEIAAEIEAIEEEAARQAKEHAIRLTKEALELSTGRREGIFSYVGDTLESALMTIFYKSEQFESAVDEEIKDEEEKTEMKVNFEDTPQDRKILMSETQKLPEKKSLSQPKNKRPKTAGRFEDRSYYDSDRAVRVYLHGAREQDKVSEGLKQKVKETKEFQKTISEERKAELIKLAERREAEEIAKLNSRLSELQKYNKNRLATTATGHRNREKLETSYQRRMMRHSPSKASLPVAMTSRNKGSSTIAEGSSLDQITESFGFHDGSIVEDLVPNSLVEPDKVDNRPVSPLVPLAATNLSKSNDRNKTPGSHEK